MATLRSQDPIDSTVPVVSAAGGNPASYRDPKSPESIMLKVKRTQVQAEVDTKFDSAEKTHENFCDVRSRPVALGLVALFGLLLLVTKLRTRR